jgi:4-hydroxybenzoate polyprenyltransferase
MISMSVKEILEFIKIEHTLFSLPFILIGYILAFNQFMHDLPVSEFSWFRIDLLWILVAAIGARGHLATGTMSIQTASILAGCFLLMLLIGAGLLNKVALMMSWLPVLAFVIYPYTKRYTWLCHLWLGLCLGLAPAGAWVAIAADVHGWAAITGMFETGTELLWLPTIFPISLGVALWITAFDINYARMDIENDRATGVYSFPARFGEDATTRTSVQLTLLWFACFAISNPMDEIWFLGVSVVMALTNIAVILTKEKFSDFQTVLFRTSMLTGWILLIPIILIQPENGLLQN